MFCLGTLLPAQATVGAGAALPGVAQGSERWIVMLRDRGYSLRQSVGSIRLAASAAKPGLIAGLRQRAQADQAAIAQAVNNAGGSVKQHYWHLSALSVEIPPAALATLRQLPRVASLWPVKSRPIASALPVDLNWETEHVLACPRPPQVNAADSLNHNIANAWTILGSYKGAGATVAVMDSGIDADIWDTNAILGPHPAFLVPGSTTASRILAHLQLPVLVFPMYADCNILTSTPPYVDINGTPSGFRPSLQFGPGHDEACGHGTAMTSIIAGNSYPSSPGLYTPWNGFGHAPEASIIDVGCSEFLGANATTAWGFTDAGYLGAVEELRLLILSMPLDVDVLNLSLHGEPSPYHPISLALDQLAIDEDIFIVTAAGNTFDSSASSNGFYHGLSVGAVHARVTGPNQNLSFVPLPQGSRGPLTQNLPGRFYPDLCATGGGIGHLDAVGEPEFDYPGPGWFVDGSMELPGIDIADQASRSSPTPNRVSPVRRALGTSEACAQVAGAATLYRGKRPTASAEETRAAILISVIGTYSSQDGSVSEPELQHTHSARNTLGVGYLRDDLLAEFAIRQPSIEPLAAIVSLSADEPSNELTVYAGLTPGARYAVAACWRRWNDESQGDVTALANVNLEVVNNAGVQKVLAESRSPANSFERAVFVAPSSGTVKFRVFTDAVFPADDPLDVQIAARRLPTDVDPSTSVADRLQASSGIVEAVSAGAACTEVDRTWDVSRIVPYPVAYGSAAFQFGGTPVRHAGYSNGFDLGSGRAAADPNLGGYQHVLHLQYMNAVVGSAVTIRGLGFRTWRPLDSNDLAVNIVMEEGPWWVPGAPGNVFPLPGSGAVTVVGGAGFRTIQAPRSRTVAGVASAATGREDFGIVVPFDAPFTYLGTGHLHLWIKVQSSQAPILEVDGTNDISVPPMEPIESHIAFYTGRTPPIVAVVTNGLAPVLGLITDSPVTARELRLVPHGEPWSGAGQTCNFDVIAFTGLPTAFVSLVQGDVSPTAIPLPGSPCSGWVSNAAVLASGFTDTFGIVSFAIPIQSDLANLELSLQALTLNGASQLRATNALRLRVGGGL